MSSVSATSLIKLVELEKRLLTIIPQSIRVSVSRFFILKLAEGFALEDIVSVIPFDTSSITKRLQQLGFIQNGELTEIGRDWACALSLHGRPYEAWVLWGYRFQIVLPADTPFLQTKSSLSGVLIYYPKKDRGMAPMNYKEKYRTLDLFRFISSEDVSFAFHDSLTREWEIKSVPCQNADGDNNVKYLVVEIPEGEEKIRRRDGSPFHFSGRWCIITERHPICSGVRRGNL